MFSRILNTFGTRAASAVINLLIAVVISQYLGPSGKGITSLVITTITFILVFANLIGGATLVYLVPRYAPALLAIPSYFWTALVSLLAYLILNFFPLVDDRYTLHICLLSALNSFTSIHTSMLIGREKIATANLVGIIQPVSLILSLLAFFTLDAGAGVEGYIYSLYISFSISFAASFVFFTRVFGRVKLHPVKDYLAIVREMARFGFLNQVAHITQMLSFRMSFYVLDRFQGEAAVGVYSNGISLAESIWLIAKSISLVQYARISNLGDRERSARFTARLVKVSLVASLLLLLPLLLLPAGFYVFLFGVGFEGTKWVIVTLAAGVLFYNFSILIGHYFSGTGRYHVNAITSTIGLVVSTALYFTLIPAYGIFGAGWATSISYMVTSLILIVWFGREYSQWYLMLLPQKDDLQELGNEIRKLLPGRS